MNIKDHNLVAKVFSILSRYEEERSTLQNEGESRSKPLPWMEFWEEMEGLKNEESLLMEM